MRRAMHWELGRVNHSMINIVVINAKAVHGIIVRQSELVLTNEIIGSSKMKGVQCVKLTISLVFSMTFKPIIGNSILF